MKKGTLITTLLLAILSSFCAYTAQGAEERIEFKEKRTKVEIFVKGGKTPPGAPWYWLDLVGKTNSTPKVISGVYHICTAFDDNRKRYLSIADGKFAMTENPTTEWILHLNSSGWSIILKSNGAMALSGDITKPILKRNQGDVKQEQIYEIKKDPAAAAAVAPSPSSYKVQVQWGGDSEPWQDQGVWVIGGRKDQAVVGLDIKSTDGGKTLSGTMTYAGEGPIRLKAEMNTKQPNYKAQVQWGAESSPWVDQGSWVIGGRKDQAVIGLQIKSADGGKTLTGTTAYAGEGPITFKAEIAK